MDVGLLVDAASTFGIDAVVQVDLRSCVHRHRPIHKLGPMATEVLLAALYRSPRACSSTHRSALRS